MQVVIEHQGAQREVDLLIEDQQASVSELVRAVDPAADVPGAGVVVGDRFFASTASLDEIGLLQGAILRLATARPGPSARGGGPFLAIVGGPDAGRIHPLDSTDITVGRDEDCDLALEDPSLSRRHARLWRDAAGTVMVADLDSSNGTWLDGKEVHEPTPLAPGALLQIGGTLARVLTRLPEDHSLALRPGRGAVGGLVPFNRPPRPPPPAEAPPLRAPDAPKETPRGRAFSIISILAPLAMAAVLFFANGRNPKFALFALLSPVMAVANWFAAKRGSKKERRKLSGEFQAALTAFERELAARAEEETARREVLLPDAAETLRRARLPSIQLWQRRPAHDDFLKLHAGLGDVPWSPGIDAGREGPPGEVQEIVSRLGALRSAPVAAALSDGGVVGLVGNRASALALARSLVCQAAVHHGPADLGIVVLASAGHAPAWDWSKWLPHVRDSSGSRRLLSSDPQKSDALLTAMVEAHKQEGRDAGAKLFGKEDRSARVQLFVLDDISLTEGRGAAARLALRGAAGAAAGIVIAETEDQLPAVVTTVVKMGNELGDATIRDLQQRTGVESFLICGVSETTARDCARRLARYEDPELEVVGAGVPQTVRLLPLLGGDEVDAHRILGAWSAGMPDPPLSTPVGVSADGVVDLSLVRDGPHGLIAGTTGSGKSELLRSLVAGLAARIDPDHLVFVLVDYKGGSAFDECSRLPHTVGLVTDLDGHLSERALKSLEAELAYRERVLREAGASDLPGYLRLGAPRGPLPRLMVIIDEFATVATELPDFMGALVGVAQRGRSLGVHLILATQRPAGVVNANIKANTNLRIALRVQDPGDSTDVIDSPDAAAIPRSTPGRAYVRRGTGDVVLVQTPLSTAAGGGEREAPVRLRPFCFDPMPPPGPSQERAHHEEPTDLARLVDAIDGAFAASGMQPPRRPWLEMLSSRIELEAVLAASAAPSVVPFALADDPEHQRQVPIGWMPADGHLAFFGMVGAGTTTAMLAIARSLAERYSPEECYIYALDFGAGSLTPLSELPHVGAVIAANEDEAQLRLLRYLRREVERRRALSPSARAGQARIVVLVDGIESFLADHDDVEHPETADAFRRVFSEGPGVDVLFVVSGGRPGALPMRLSSLVSQKVLFRLAEPSDFGAIGLRPREVPAFVAGRAVHGDSKMVIQVGHPGDDFKALGEVLRDRWPDSFPPPRIASLPARLRYESLPGGARLDPPLVELTLGIADEDLGPAVLTLRPTDHALVTGPPGSGKTSTLMLIASLVRAAGPGAVLVGICDKASPLYELEALDAAGSLGQLAHIIRAAPGDSRPWFILVDDAVRVADVEEVMTAALRSGRPGLHVVAADRSDDINGGYGHWTRAIRQSRCGVLLQPDLASDGALLSARLPRRLAIPLVPGRGFVVSAGNPALGQIALPPGA